jgi:hypothetical protein
VTQLNPSMIENGGVEEFAQDARARVRNRSGSEEVFGTKAASQSLMFSSMRC